MESLFSFLPPELYSTVYNSVIIIFCFITCFSYSLSQGSIVLKDKADAPRFNIYLLGQGTEHDNLERLINDNGLNDTIHLLGFDRNPYKYISRMDLFVCSSHREGYSTATSEAVALGVPVLTTNCSGMDEILEDGKYGLIVENTDDALYQGLEQLVCNPDEIARYKEILKERPRVTTLSLVAEYEKLFDTMLASAN